MNTLQKLAQVNKAAKYVLRTRRVKKAYDQNWIDMVQYLAETGPLAPESIEAIKKEYEKGRLLSALQRAGKGAWESAKLGGGIGAAIGGTLGGISGGIPGALMSGGLSGLSSGLISGIGGAGLNGIIDLLEYNKNKEQLKSILDKVNSEGVPSEVAVNPSNELYTAAMV